MRQRVSPRLIRRLKNAAFHNVKKRYFRLVRECMNDPMPVTCRNYQSELVRHNILTLKNGRIFFELFLIYNVFNGNIISPEILQGFCLHVPSRELRSKEIFHVELHKSNYGRFNIINCISMLANKYSGYLDIFHDSRDTFRCCLLTTLTT